MSNFLSIPEELFLLTVHETDGNTQPTHKRSFRVAMSGAILMNLALEHHIDTDLKSIIIDDDEYVDDVLLDIVFKQIQLHQPQRTTIEFWLDKIADHVEVYNTVILNSLMKKGVLKIEERKVFWVFSSRRYPVQDNTEIKEVKARVRDLIFSDEIPDVQDLVIVSLLFYSKSMDLVLSEEEISQKKERIQQIAKMDFIGQSIHKLMEKSVFTYFIQGLRNKLNGPQLSAEELLETKAYDMMKEYELEMKEDLPDWLVKGTSQYEKTLDFVKKAETANVSYDPETGEYKINKNRI